MPRPAEQPAAAAPARRAAARAPPRAGPKIVILARGGLRAGVAAGAGACRAGLRRACEHRRGQIDCRLRRGPVRRRRRSVHRTVRARLEYRSRSSRLLGDDLADRRQDLVHARVASPSRPAHDPPRLPVVLRRGGQRAPRALVNSDGHRHGEAPKPRCGPVQRSRRLLVAILGNGVAATRAAAQSRITSPMRVAASSATGRPPRGGRRDA